MDGTVSSHAQSEERGGRGGVKRRYSILIRAGVEHLGEVPTLVAATRHQETVRSLRGFSLRTVSSNAEHEQQCQTATVRRGGPQPRPSIYMLTFPAGTRGRSKQLWNWKGFFTGFAMSIHEEIGEVPAEPLELEYSLTSLSQLVLRAVRDSAGAAAQTVSYMKTSREKPIVDMCNNI